MSAANSSSIATGAAGASGQDASLLGTTNVDMVAPKGEVGSYLFCNLHKRRGGPLDTSTHLLQSTAEDLTSSSNSSRLVTEITAAPKHSHELPDNTPPATAAAARSSTEHAPIKTNINNYPNLFDSPDPALSGALRWAQANAMHPQVASWLHACSQWDSAVAAKEHRHQTKRRRLCKDHDIPCTKIVDSNAKLDAAMEYIRRHLSSRI